MPASVVSSSRFPNGVQLISYYKDVSRVVLQPKSNEVYKRRVSTIALNDRRIISRTLFVYRILYIYRYTIEDICQADDKRVVGISDSINVMVRLSVIEFSFPSFKIQLNRDCCAHGENVYVYIPTRSSVRNADNKIFTLLYIILYNVKIRFICSLFDVHV